MAVQEPERIGTPALGLHILKKTQDEGNADPVDISAGVIEVQTAADLLNEAASRAAERAIQRQVEMGSRGGGGSKKETGAWIRWVVGLVIMLIGLVWTGSFLLASRTTEDKVEHMIQTAPQNADTKAKLVEHEEEIQVQKLQLNTIEGTVKNIDKTVGEIKKDLKEKR